MLRIDVGQNACSSWECKACTCACWWCIEEQNAAQQEIEAQYFPCQDLLLAA